MQSFQNNFEIVQHLVVPKPQHLDAGTFECFGTAVIDARKRSRKSAPRQWQVLSLVTFFGPAKKVSRPPAGTGEFDWNFKA
jgi:hypothetical protein